MQLRPNAVELIFRINGCSCRLLWRQSCGTAAGDSGSYNAFRFLIDKSFPNRFRSRLGTCQHAFDRSKDRQLGAMQFVLRGKQGGRADVAQKHVRLLHIVERSFERSGDCFLNQTFAQSDSQIAGQNLDDVLTFARGQDRQSLLQQFGLGDRSTRPLELLKKFFRL